MRLAEIVVTVGTVLLGAWAVTFARLTSGERAPEYRGRHRNA